MSKQNDLMNVFKFLAEYLREETTNVEVVGFEAPQPVEVEPTKDLVDPQILGVPSRDILELIKKVENIDKQKAEVKTIIKEHDKSFAKELKRIKEEHEELIKEFETKVAYEESPLTSSGSTVTNSIAFVME